MGVVSSSAFLKTSASANGETPETVTSRPLSSLIGCPPPRTPFPPIHPPPHPTSSRLSSFLVVPRKAALVLQSVGDRRSRRRRSTTPRGQQQQQQQPKLGKLGTRPVRYDADAKTRAAFKRNSVEKNSVTQQLQPVTPRALSLSFLALEPPFFLCVPAGATCCSLGTTFTKPNF